MAKRASRELTLRDLDFIRSMRLKEIAALEKEREKLKQQMGRIGEQLLSLRGQRGGRPAVAGEEPGRRRRRRRFRNPVPLPQLLVSILQKAERPMKTAELIEQVARSGYRSAAKNLRSVVYQAIYNSPHIVPAKDKSGYLLKNQTQRGR